MKISHFNWSKALFLLFSCTVLLVGAQGCVATRDWVTEQISPLAGRVSGAEGRLGQIDAKAERALSNLANLRLQRRFVLDLKEGANFAFNSVVLTDQAKREIDGFFSDLKGDMEETDSAVILVAGHTDSVGSDDYNYELGRKRSESVARYLITQKKVDPTRVIAVSYGKSAPLAENSTREGRSKNRRVEILVYKEAITSASSAVETGPRAEARMPE